MSIRRGGSLVIAALVACTDPVPSRSGGSNPVDRSEVRPDVVVTATVPPSSSKGPVYGLGTPVTEAEIEPWDIDVRPDGRGLPKGGGTARQGREVYAQKCAACHGDSGEGKRVQGALLPIPALRGGIGSLNNPQPIKTVGSYWPFATTIYDYVYRAMPPGQAQSLTPDETYAVVAHILHLNGIISGDARLDAETLPSVRMPNRDGFVPDPRLFDRASGGEPSNPFE